MQIKPNLVWFKASTKRIAFKDKLLILELGLIRSNANANMYYKDKKIVIILLYVNDLLLTRGDKKKIKRMQRTLIENFEMTNLGLTRFYLGVEFEYLFIGIWLHWQTYIRKIFNMCAMNNCMSTKILMDICVQLHKKMGIWRINLELYISLVGRLIYVTNMRLNIHFAMSCVSKYVSEQKQSSFISH